MDTLQNDSITIEVALASSVKKVWKAWTDPDLILKWFGSDPHGTGIKATLDVRPGGSFEVTFRDSDQTEHTCSGVYAKVMEFSELSFTWTWKSEPAVETFVTIMLTAEGDATRMFFQHARLGAASMHDYASGWKTTFLKLERMLNGRA